MNAPLTPSHVSSKHASQARFSPAGHRTAAFQPAISATPARPHAAIAGYSYSSRADAAEDFFSQIWTPGLLDRLQAPLTRYRE